ncbi:zinc-binding dehydrogenase [bacterium BD-1]|nr:zinc-binding dehydrogenase [Ottowia caeni]
MKAWWIKSAGESMALELRNTAAPQPGPGQIAVRIRSASLNRGEFIAGHGLHAAGAARPAGFEAAGEVIALGVGVHSHAVGERVMGRCDGSFAEQGVMLAEEAFRVPDCMSWEQAACGYLVYYTVHDALIEQGRLRSGEWLLVPGISSGVGVAALQVAKALGAKVFGTSRSEAKLSALRKLGLDMGLRTALPDFVPAVMEATRGRGADLAVNPVGGSMFAGCAEALAFEGRLATVGYVDGIVRAEIDLAALHKKRLKLFGVSNKLRTTEHRIAACQAFARDVLPLLKDGSVVPLVDKVFSFERLPDAQTYMQSSSHLGKIVIRMH